MKKLRCIVYRDKTTGQIVSYRKIAPACSDARTKKMVKTFEAADSTITASIAEYEPGTLTEYLIQENERKQALPGKLIADAKAKLKEAENSINQLENIVRTTY